MPLQTKPAKGVKGYIMRGADIDGNRFYFFRVYDEEHNFKDYDILHFDLEIVILEDDATFYESETTKVLDHAPLYKGLNDE